MTVPTPPTRQQLQAINKRSLKYPLDVAEKDYFLAAALDLIAHSPLREVLVFKGGTALHHCYLGQYRFSEDLDFSCRIQGGVTLDEVREVLEAAGLFEVHKQYASPATIKIERLRYSGILDQPGAIKIEIDHQQNVLLEPPVLSFRNVWGLAVELPVMDIREMAAEKVRAAAQRARYRDFYDLFLIVESCAPVMEELVALLRRKEVRSPVTVESVRENWGRAAREFADGVDRIHYSKAIAPEEIEQMVRSLRFDPILPWVGGEG